MKKQELIQTHRLLALIRNEMTEEGVIEGAPEYDELGVSPQSIHLSKSDHEDAILTLSEDLATELDAAEVDGETVTV